MSDSPHLPHVDYQLSFAGGPEATWAVVELEIDEALDRPYQATIDAMTTTQHIDTDALLGADATLTMARGDGEPQCLHGVVVQVNDLGAVDRGWCVRVHLAPAFELLRQRVDSRIWQDASVQDIVGEVLGRGLGDYERSAALGEIQRGAAARDYCVQYRESDLDYVARLLEEEGISYLFVHSPDEPHELLTLRDDNDQYPSLADEDEVLLEIPIVALHAPEAMEVESIQRFERIRRLTSTASLRRDFDWSSRSQLLSSSHGDTDKRGIERRRYAHSDRRFCADDLAQQSSDLCAAQTLAGVVARGHSNTTVLRPGCTFRILDHEHDGLDDSLYIVTEVMHRGWQDMNLASAAKRDEPHYTNEFRCVPASAQIRPSRRTPKPRVHGPQTAIVIGEGVEGAEEIHTDAHGRVKLRFHWEQDPETAGDASCWVRCAQALAGPSYGAQFIPRVGMEVVVEFLEGNPDRPLVIGCVYNGDNASAFGLPESETQSGWRTSKTQSGWRTSSSPGGGGGNELRFEDEAGNEEIYIRGHRDLRVAVGNDNSQTVGSNETRTIGNNQRTTVGVDQSVSVGCSQYSEVGVSCTQTVGLDHTQMIGLAHNQVIGGLKTVAVGAMHNAVVGGAYNVVVGGALTQSVAGLMMTTVGALSLETVVGAKTVSAGMISETAGFGYSQSSGMGMSLSAGSSMSLDSGGGMSMRSGGGMMLESQEMLYVDALGKKLVLKCGKASITLEDSGDITIKGKNIWTAGDSVASNC